QSHTLLAVIRSVREADSGAGKNENAANPPRRSLAGFGGMIQLFVLDNDLAEPQQQGGREEAEDGAEEQRFEYVGRFRPINAFAEHMAGRNQRIRQAYSHDGT